MEPKQSYMKQILSTIITVHCRYCNGSTVETFTVLSAMETG